MSPEENVEPKIKFIMEASRSLYGHIDGARIEMHIPNGIDKDGLYEHFLDFVKGCGYHVDNGMCLIEEDPDAPDEYTQGLETQLEEAENKIEELEQQLAPAEELLQDYEEGDKDVSDS